MAKNVANVNVTVDTFGDFFSKTNILIEAMREEVLTANSTWANTGTPAAQRNAQLYGKFVANTIYVATALSGGTNTSTTAALNVTSNAFFSGANVGIVSNTYVRGANLELQSNSTVTAIKISGNSTATNTTIAGTTLNLTANVAANLATFTGNATFNDSINLQDIVVSDATSNADIGTGLTGKVVYTFPIATYTSGKFLVQIQNTGNNQVTEAIVVHDDTDATVTTYATVAAPAGGNDTPLGTISANVNGTDCEIVVTQAANNSAVQVYAQLMKG